MAFGDGALEPDPDRHGRTLACPLRPHSCWRLAASSTSPARSNRRLQWANLKPTRSGRWRRELTWRSTVASDRTWFSEDYRAAALYGEQLDAELDWS